MLIDSRLVPYLNGSPTEKRLINLALYTMLLVSPADEIDPQPTPLYAKLIPLARTLGRQAAQSSQNQTQKDRDPGSRGHGLKQQQMAESEGRSSKTYLVWKRIWALHARCFE